MGAARLCAPRPRATWSNLSLHWPTLEKKLAGEEIPKLDEPVRRIMPEGPYVRVRRKKGQCAIEASKERRRIERDDTP